MCFLSPAAPAPYAAGMEAESATRRVGRRVRELRQRARLSIDQLAERAGVTHESVGRLERAVSPPNLRTLEQVARALGVDLAALFVDTVPGTTNLPAPVREIVARLEGRPEADLERARAVIDLLFPQE